MSECKCDYSNPAWAPLTSRPEICAWPSYESDGVCRNCFHDIECHSPDDLTAMIDALACDVVSATEKSPSFKAVPLSSLKMLLKGGAK